MTFKLSLGLFLFMNLSCTGQSPKVDLQNDVLGKSKNDLVFEGIILRETDIVPSVAYGVLEKEIESHFGFYDINLSGAVEKGRPYGTNNLSFYYKKETQLINAIKFTSYQTDLSKQVEAKIIEVYGQPNFTGFQNEKLKIEGVYSRKVWEDKQRGGMLFLELKRDSKIHDKSVLETIVCIVDSSDSILVDYFCGGGFQYWGDFLERRNSIDDKNYTYQDFLEEKKNNVSDYYNKLTQ